MRYQEFAQLDGVATATAIAQGDVTALDVARTAMSIVDALNPHLNAVICKDYDRALQTAEKSDTRTHSGPLAGVPFLLKDVYQESDGMPTTYGSRYLMGTAARADSELVSQWRTGGLNILGKTNAPEFAADFVTEPLAYGATINPWDPAITVGGSSGGAASAVAAGMVPVAHATDLGGSIRIPSACCVTFGFKPTAGLNSVGPYFKEVAHGLNSDHVITRSVRDSAAALDITARSAAVPSRYLEGLAEKPRKLKILATVHAADGTLAGPRQVKAILKTIDILRDCGHEVTFADSTPLAPVGEWFDLLWVDDIPALLTAREAESGVRHSADQLEPLTLLCLEELRRAGPRGLAEALRRREETAKEHLALFGNYDMVLTPSLATDPAPVGKLGFRDHPTPQSWAVAGYGFAPFFILANVTGQPAASLPLPMDGGLPVGIHLMAKPHQDLLLLQLSKQLETVFDWMAAYRTHWANMEARYPALGKLR